MLRHCMKDRDRVIDQVDRNQENSKDLGKPRGSQSIAGPSHLRNARQGKPPIEGSKNDMTGQYDKARGDQDNYERNQQGS
ncbi:hypothetical protein TNCV_2611251 [Trichonephila clavipes]|nr:hypothetical protein TNCV_2611251 [Trichonephila clavipes]